MASPKKASRSYHKERRIVRLKAISNRWKAARPLVVLGLLIVTVAGLFMLYQSGRQPQGQQAAFSAVQPGKSSSKKGLTAQPKLDTSTLDLRNIGLTPSASAPELVQLQQLSSSNKAVARYEINYVSDGPKQYGQMTLPVTSAPIGGYPVVILCHGYVNPDRYKTTGNDYLFDMNFYSQHGFAVIKPDLRGNGESEGVPEGAYYSLAYAQNILDLIASIRQTSYLDKDNISMWGHSMGGYLALRTAVLVPDIKNVIILSGAVGTAKDMYSIYYSPSDRLNPEAKKIRERVLSEKGTPFTNPDFWYNTSPINFLNQSRAYFQIHVGSNDKVVPPVFSKDLDGALTSLGKQHDYFVYNKGEHGLVPERSVIWQRSLTALTTARNQ